jgi:cytochrome P450
MTTTSSPRAASPPASSPASSAPPVVDPFTATAPGARHAAWAALAATGSVHRGELPGGTPAWLVTGADEVRAVLTDPWLSKVPARPPGASAALPPEIDAAINTDLLHLDPPDHTRLRRLVSSAFTRRRVEELAPRVQQVTDALLDDLADAATSGPGAVDLVAGFAYPLPITVICELLGVPEQGRDAFRRWSRAIVGGPTTTPQDWVTAATAMTGYVRELLAGARARPADDLLTALVAARDGDDRLTEDELTSMVFLLLVAGHETTVGLIGNAVHALLTHPDQLAELRTRPERISGAVEELLRFDGPVQVATYRWTTAPVEIGGTVIPAGELVVPGLLAANRDPGRTPDPDVLDLGRPPAQHLAFGLGAHHCLGAPLARLEGRIALGSLLARFPALRLAVPADRLRWRPGVLMHGLVELPVDVRGEAVA